MSKICLKQEKVTLNDNKVVNIYITRDKFVAIYMSYWFLVTKVLFRADKLTKNADINNYSYLGYSIGFDAHRKPTFSDCSRLGKNVIIFGADMGSSVHAHLCILILTIKIKIFCPTDGLDDTTLTAEKEYSVNFIMGK